MRELNKIFFAEEGQPGKTSTSAAHLCALAAQEKTKYEKYLAKVNFIDEKITVVGSDQYGKRKVGYKEIEPLYDAIEKIGNLNALISWFSEGRKELEAHKAFIDSLTMADFCNMKGVEVPEMPEFAYGSDLAEISMENVIAQLPAKERLQYLSLEAKSSAYGKFIHPDQPFDVARDVMYSAINEPCSTEGAGKDTILVEKTPSIKPEKVEGAFMTMMSRYRKLEQSLNHMKADLRNKMTAYNDTVAQKREEFAAKYDDIRKQVQIQRENLRTELWDWKNKQNQELSKIRFSVPENLKETVTYLESL